MNIEIKPKVKEYLTQMNVHEIYIEMENQGGCCAGDIHIPVIRLGAPTNINVYKEYLLDNISVYFPKKLNNVENEHIVIKLRNILGKKSLVVSGLLGCK